MLPRFIMQQLQAHKYLSDTPANFSLSTSFHANSEIKVTCKISLYRSEVVDDTAAFSSALSIGLFRGDVENIQWSNTFSFLTKNKIFICCFL